jgi:hypothetical protein
MANPIEVVGSDGKNVMGTTADAQVTDADAATATIIGLLRGILAQLILLNNSG